jgi:hypothetical protein
MERTWRPRVAGILCIIAGAIGVVAGIWLVLLALVLTSEPGGGVELSDAPIIRFGILGIIAIIIAIVGGVYALRRRIWGLALAGSICVLFCPPGYLIFAGFHDYFELAPAIVGIPAIIFVSLGKGEFK